MKAENGSRRAATVLGSLLSLPTTARILEKMVLQSLLKYHIVGAQKNKQLHSETSAVIYSPKIKEPPCTMMDSTKNEFNLSFFFLSMIIHVELTCSAGWISKIFTERLSVHGCRVCL